MPLALPRFYAIIDRSVRPERPLDEIVRVLTGAGVRLIQVRAKQARHGGQATSQGLLSETCQILSLLPSGSLLLVNDRADVAKLAGAAGVHLGQHDLPAEAARALLGSEKIIGLSTHSRAQIEAGNARPVDYLAFGPLFPTATKAEAEPVVGPARLREVRALTDKPLVAIGGITPTNAGEAIEAGADSVAVISGWLAADDMAGRLEEFRQVLGRLD